MDGKILIQRLLIGITILAGLEAALFTAQTLNPNEVHSASDNHGGRHRPPGLTVNHRVVGDDLKLELNVSGFTFSLDNMGKDNRHGEGHAHLYLDGKKVAKIFERSYTYSDIPPGRHQVVVELAHNNHESYGVKQSFEIVVPQ